MKTLSRLAGRVVLGTGVYAAIIALASPLPAAAGMMLTFPALNGLAFYFSEDERAAAIAKSMFWMPIINGAFCAAYVALFLLLLLLAKTAPPTVIGWTLLLIETALWLVWVSRSHVRTGIDRPRQLTFAVAATLAGVALAAASLMLAAHFGLSTPRAEAHPASVTEVADAVLRGRLKIVLFALTLGVLVSAIQYFPISDSTRGILAGLPIVPFGGLVSIAGDPSLVADSRVETFLGMIGGVWLGPPIAIWYIFCFSRHLDARKRIGAPAADSLVRFGALLTAWLVTFAVIVAIAYSGSALRGGGSIP